MAKILLVEDNEMNRDLMALRLSRSGFDVVMATNGLEAIEQHENTILDLILMDLNLPKLDGWEATRLIRQKTGVSAQLPIIALSASATTEERALALQAGCDTFISKPVNMQKLLAAIDHYLREGSHG